MAAPASKRALPSKVQAMKARKRIKMTGGTHDLKPPKAGQRHKVMGVEALSWKDVSLPDRMDDYEGFFGLEEVEDVDVIRDASTGKVDYFSKSSIKPKTAVASTTATDLGEDDFSGFDDQESAKSPPPSTPKQHANSTKRGKKAAPNAPGAKVPADTVLPALNEADVEREVDVSAWKPLKLSPDTLAALAKLKFIRPTPIQQASIPQILDGHDVIGKASTGSGKTLAFGIPILESFLESRTKKHQEGAKAPLALILSPTRELAHQLGNHLEALCSTGIFEGPSIAVLTGGLSLQKQQRVLKVADIVIGTPGRLWEIISSGQGVGRLLKRISFLVVDEADRLLSEGHYKELEHILDTLDRNDTSEQGTESHKGGPTEQKEENTSTRQTLVFSATFDRGLQKKLNTKTKWVNELMSNKQSMEYLLSKLKFREEAPKFVDVNPVKQLASGLKEGVIECGGLEKDLYLYALLLHHLDARTLVFANSISAVRRIVPFLQNLNIPALALHSGMPQKARLRSVERFTQNSDKHSCSVLIATDVAARGLDIPDVQLVIHYHLPRAADMYVHRSGRTARAGRQGSSILICSPEEVAGVRRLVAKVHAQSAVAKDENASEAAKQGYYIRTLDPDRKIVARLKQRATLAKKLADVTTAKEKQHKEDSFLRAAAEELGVDYDSEEFEKQAPGRHGRGSGRKEKERKAREVSKSDAASMRAELKELLKERVNIGVSETYITSGRVDVDELLRQQDAGSKTGEFLGNSSGFGLEEG